MTSIPKGNIIKHRKYRDAAFYVEKCFDVGHKLKIKGYWMNQGFEKSWIIDNDSIIIHKNKPCDRGQWFIANDPEVKCLRDTDWRPLC